MSARRRQETIARFSVPIEGDTVSSSTQVSATQAANLVPSQRSSRRTRSTRSVIDESIDDDRDDDFVMDAAQEDDDDFIDDEDDDSPFTQSKKGKGKATGKGKKAVPARAPVPSSIQFDGVNPRVMLISLKAGALGLNLTVANNVYL